ncbi:hypothetical protein SAM23877_6146 [Streptomyces ambofaciens ATCC 23877]|uniref:Uncharacterized protein n=1 Tax=Streptomyces ambofaciens (strain ATCC 23877 / 3486 / DSM 40053 / JCM 4204 / NBRC 12836 / NRRL B-2516) TaxID=278992 RepID=A0A0K2B223_STRA7|nr:phiSA1p31-related protein [Streptomyces ambofaciens]AKZ59191.1 hypothetical protein SAM23877_6146 [Streptomyces ambofaciens ATCC 23877]WNA15384.1 putative DNA binding domain protein [Streptomyces phage Samy]
MAFKVGDKVDHRTFGKGEVVFGPFEHTMGSDFYLMKQEHDGAHALTAGEALTQAAKFKVGNKAQGTYSGRVYTIVGGPYRGPAGRTWYATESTDGMVTNNDEDDLLTVTPEPAKDEAIVDGVTYDLTARYRDRDGDYWTFKDVDGTVRGECSSYDRDNSEHISSYSDPLESAVRNFGPLTRV